MVRNYSREGKEVGYESERAKGGWWAGVPEIARPTSSVIRGLGSSRKNILKTEVTTLMSWIAFRSAVPNWSYSLRSWSIILLFPLTRNKPSSVIRGFGN